MATGTINKNGTWVTINNRLKYMVNNGTVYVYISVNGTEGDSTTIGNLPASIKPFSRINQVFFCDLIGLAQAWILTDGTVQGASKNNYVGEGIISYPLS